MSSMGHPSIPVCLSLECHVCMLCKSYKYQRHKYAKFVFRNLLFVKNYPGDVTKLDLDFSVVNDVLGVTSHVELKPGGKQLLVNNNNRIEYVHLMADYKLNKQVSVLGNQLGILLLQ